LTIEKPSVGSTLRVAQDGLPAFDAIVERVLGQFIYVAGFRFHVLDDMVSDSHWRYYSREGTFDIFR
jgi:hypothetical protein